MKSFYYFSKKFYNRKLLHRYHRPINYDMKHNDYYKDFVIKRRISKDDPTIEVLPIGEEYKKTIVWLYAGDWPENMIFHLCEFDSFPPKVN